MIQPMCTKQDYARAICLFLAEQLRYQKVGLNRAAEIAQKMLDNINLVDSEEDFLRLIKELSKDFEELDVLEKQVFFRLQTLERCRMESFVKQFAIFILPHNPGLALNVLLEAVKKETDFELLALKYPEFRKFISDQNIDLSKNMEIIRNTPFKIKQ